MIVSFGNCAQHLSHLFKTAIRSRQQEILNWYYYSLEFENKVRDITANGKIKDKAARTMIYKEMKPFLPNITQDNLRKKTLRARKLLMLFGKDGVGIDKIKQVTYSANEISKLTNIQIQNIINQVTLKTVPSGNDQTNAEVSALSNARSALSPKDNILPENKIPSINHTSVSSNPAHDRDYFRNKILGRYPYIYKTIITEKFDYYGIIEGSLCPMCKQSHEDGKSVKGRYEAGSYFIKCGKHEIEITA